MLILKRVSSHALSLVLFLALAFFIYQHTSSTKVKLESTLSAGSQYNAGIAMGSIHGMSTYQLNEEFRGISNLGFSWVRFDFTWAAIQPTGPTSYDWSQYDNAVSIASYYHLKILGILDYAPSWAASPDCVEKTHCAPRSALQFATYAAAAATHYKAVATWEIWNEENDGKYWSPQPNPAVYESVLKLSYSFIKAQEPQDTVLMGGMAGGGETVKPSSYTQINAVSYLQQLYADGSEGYFDGIAYHPYSYPQDPSSATAGNAWLEMNATNPSLRSVMVANGDSNKQIWITEYGAPTNGPSSKFFVSPSDQTIELQQALSYLENQSWAGPFFWYTYRDNGTNTSSNENFFGLISYNSDPKPAYYEWGKLLKN
jgi:hypothetical protein